MSQGHRDDEFVSISVRVTRDLADQFKAVADSEFRPVAAELRRLMQERVDQHETRSAA